MVKILAGIGDLHMRKKDWYREGLKEFEKWIDQKFPDNFRENTEIVLVGDIFNKVSLLPSTAGDAFTFFEILKRKAKNVYVILGNHDYGLHKYEIINTKDYLEKLNVKVISDLQVLKTELGFNVLCLPWKPATSHKDVNDYCENLKDQKFDAVATHWELESLFGSDFVDLSKVNKDAVFGGHIHQHNTNPNLYLGSVLPNSITELKDEHPSVVRMVVKKEDCSNKVQDFNIPNFLDIRKVYVKDSSLSELETLEKSDKIYYQIITTNNIHNRDVKNKMKILGLNLYGVESFVNLTNKEETTETEISFSNENSYSLSSEKLLETYKPILKIEESVYEKCISILRQLSA